MKMHLKLTDIQVGDAFLDKHDGEVIRIDKVVNNTIYCTRITDFPLCDKTHNYNLDFLNKYYDKKLTEDEYLAYLI